MPALAGCARLNAERTRSEFAPSRSSRRIALRWISARRALLSRRALGDVRFAISAPSAGSIRETRIATRASRRASRKRAAASMDSSKPSPPESDAPLRGGMARFFRTRFEPACRTLAPKRSRIPVADAGIPSKSGRSPRKRSAHPDAGQSARLGTEQVAKPDDLIPTTSTGDRAKAGWRIVASVMPWPCACAGASDPVPLSIRDRPRSRARRSSLPWRCLWTIPCLRP